jgi:hypothetical protein
MKELRPTPSLRGTPAPADIDEIWIINPRTLFDRLRLGSRLLDLEPSVDNSFLFKENAISGRREIIARHSGVKGWLQIHCPTVAYTTAMGYKKLASRLKTLCGVQANVPFEWLLPDAPEISTLTSDSSLAEAIADGRKKLSGFFDEGKTFTGLQTLAEKRMNIIRLPPKNTDFSLIFGTSKRKSGGGGRKGGGAAVSGKRFRRDGVRRGAGRRPTPAERHARRLERRTELRRQRRLDALPQQLAALGEALRQSEVEPRNFAVLRQLAELFRL